MSRIFVIANQKGGVGKTTTAINLASSMAINNKKVLLIDMDPQANTTSGLGVVKNEIQHGIYKCLIGQCEPSFALLQTKIENLYLLPATIDLVGAQIELIEFEDKEFFLKKVVGKLKNDFDFIIIDTPPSLGILTINGLVAADGVIIPLQCEYYALEGLSQLLNTIKLIQTNFNPHLQVDGILLTMYDSRTNLSSQVVEEVTGYFKDKVYQTIIPRNVRLSEAPSFGMPVQLYDPLSIGAKSYVEFTKEIIRNEEKRQ